MKKEDLRRDRLEMVRRFHRSEMSRAEFSKAEGIPVSTLDYWRARTRSPRNETADAEPFIEVEVEDVTTARAYREPSLEVELPMGIKLRFFGGRI